MFRTKRNRQHDEHIQPDDKSTSTSHWNRAQQRIRQTNTFVCGVMGFERECMNVDGERPKNNRTRRSDALHNERTTFQTQECTGTTVSMRWILMNVRVAFMFTHLRKYAALRRCRTPIKT